MAENLMIVVTKVDKKVSKTEIIEELRDKLDNLHYYNSKCIICGWIEYADDMKRCSKCQERICKKCIKRTGPGLNKLEDLKYICSDCNDELNYVDDDSE
jgi:hypothetical protein